MSFTALAGTSEGLPEWVVETRNSMDPALRDELDFLMTYPATDWGILGALEDVLFLHREAWGSIDALLEFVERMPIDGDTLAPQSSIRGLMVYATEHTCVDFSDPTAIADMRERIMARAAEAGLDPATAVALYDNPEEARARLLRLIRRFYSEHYRPDEGRRVAIMERTADAHGRRPLGDVNAFVRSVMRRDDSCIRDRVDQYEQLIFIPSVDLGPYASCADFPPVHGLFFPVEPEFVGATPDVYDAQRLALVYKALADEQRLQILRVLQDGELYANEIVAKTGQHQSVVSRHLSFMKAVGLVNARRESNMKFYSLNREMRGELSGALDALLPPARSTRTAPSRRERRRVHVE
jgi:DNA-binding transcriptional ArsR family regulator